MTQTIIERLLEERIGLSAETVGSDLIAKTVQKCLKARKNLTLKQYLASLQSSEDEWNEFVETILVPETWFFRNNNAFLFLAEYIRTEWRQGAAGRKLCLLSIPCSSGEEPYSIAITLFDSGLSQNEFQLDAVDLSRKSLQKARDGNYGRESFRGAQDFSFRDRFFTRQGMLYQIHREVKDAVHFAQGNLLELDDWGRKKSYDVIFCRNVLIYLGQIAKTKAVKTLDRLLTEQGVLFVGHAERPVFKGMPFEWVTQPGVFACRRAKSPNLSPETKPRSVASAFLPSPEIPAPISELPPEIPRFERRRTERFILEPKAVQRTARRSEDTLYTGVERRQSEDENAKRLEAARQLADQGKLTEALENCERVIQEEPANVQAYFLKGLIFQALRNEKGAEEFFHKALYLNPNHDEALAYLLLIAEHRGDREKAERLRLRMQRIQGTQII